MTARRALIVSPGYPPNLGGVEAHVGAIATELVRLGWHVDVLTARRGVRRVEVVQVDGVRVTTYPAWSLSAMSLSPRLVWAALRPHRQYDVVHVHSYHASTGLAALRRRRRLVFTPHYHGGGHSPAARLLHRGYRLLARRCFANADAIVCVSAAEEQHLVRDHPKARGKTTVIPNGVESERIRAARPFLDQPPTIISLGRVESYKRIDLLVRAMDHVPAPARLVVIGDGPARAGLQALADAGSAADRIDLLGRVDDLTVDRWLATATVLGSMSEHEAFGIAPLEAAAGGARVVLSDLPAHREIAEAYLQDRATIVSELSPASVADALCATLGRGRTVPAEVPRWDDVAAATAAVYSPHDAVTSRKDP